MKYFFYLLLFSILSLTGFSEENVRVKIIDVGAGLACIIKATDDDGKNHYVIYDTGNSLVAFEQMKKFTGDTKLVDFLIISHVDTDHLRSTRKVVDHYRIKNILHTGFQKNKNKATWEKAMEAISDEVKNGAKEYNQLTSPMKIGHTFKVGPAEFTLLSGFGQYPSDWEVVPDSESLNAVSIVLKLGYKDKTILFTGDAVGRYEDKDFRHCIATEKFLIKNNKDNRSIKADVLIAPHHGGNDCSSFDFIETVQPRHVIYSAGSMYNHPNLKTVTRYMDWAKSKDKKMYLYRTDYGDNKDGVLEWKIVEAMDGDEKNDDHIFININKDGVLQVNYDKGSDGKPFDATK